MGEMFGKLTAAWQGKGPALGVGSFLVLLAISALAAIVVAQLYVRFYGQRATGSEIHRAFPLIAIAVTAIFICIQFSLPLSLGLLGALSIVRFRTPIKEPEEIGFLMVVIATSLAAATGLLSFLGGLLAAAVIVLLVQDFARPIFRRRASTGLVIATFDGAGYAAHGKDFFAALTTAGRSGILESLTRLEGRVTVTWRFAGLPSSEAPEVERVLQEHGAPESLTIVYPPSTSAR
ncbi:MAG: DUF4956 domain-containing protein [Thermoanaerobaculia bacterium]